MSREKRVLNFIKRNPYTTLLELATYEQVSERTMRQIIKLLKEGGKKGGYQLKTIRNSGYVLQIENLEKFHAFEKYAGNQDDRVMSQTYRANVILKLLLQQKTFLTINELANYLNVGRSTVIKDLGLVRDLLAEEDIELLSKSHYGLKISGEELAIRKALIRYVVKEESDFPTESDYFEFVKKIDQQSLAENVQAIFQKNKLSASNLSFFSVITHIKMLLYRLSEDNLISEFKREKTVDLQFDLVANELTDFLEKSYQIAIPPVEREYLSAQIAGKTSIDNLSVEEQNKIKELLDRSLKTIDLQFSTRFEKDPELRNALLLHIYPFVQRMTFKLELTNPLIDVVSARYANTFLIALRFAKLIENYLCEEIGEIAISRDEIGYLALHFSASMERQEAQIIDNIRRIFLLSNEGRGTDSLLKLKIKKNFPNAHVIQRTSLDGLTIQANDVDLFLTTNQHTETVTNCQTIKISSMPTESEMRFLKKQIVLNNEMQMEKSGKQKILDLFQADLFKIIDEETQQSYQQLISQMAQEIVALDFAPADFVSSVLKRENTFSTVYHNGIAGPHGMSMNAYHDCISVCLLKNPIREKDRIVSIIFLLNMKKGHLFLYKEISHLLMTLIESKDSLKKVLASRNFNNFLKEISELI